MIVGIVAGQRQGKGIVGAGIILRLMAEFGYKPGDSCGNQTIFVPNWRKFKNEQILNLLHVMVEEHVRGKIIWVAEADRAFPPRYWRDDKQTKALIGLQQDEKLMNWFIWDSHLRMPDVYLVSATQILVVPKYKPYLDCVDVEISWLHDMKPHKRRRITNVSKRIFPYYDTYEPVE